MFTIDELLQPSSLEEASALLTANPEAVVLGGCGFLKMGSRRITKAMDLSRCGLNGIRETESQIELDAMTTLYDVETSTALNRLADAVLPKAVGNILGVQFRRCATIGASVYSKYGFSDILPALMVLHTEVELMRAGRMSLPEFMDKPIVRDILLRVIIRKDNRHAAYLNLRNASADFPIVNAAVSRHRGQWTIVGGADQARQCWRQRPVNMLRSCLPNKRTSLKLPQWQLKNLRSDPITKRPPNTVGPCLRRWRNGRWRRCWYANNNDHKQKNVCSGRGAG